MGNEINLEEFMEGLGFSFEPIRPIVKEKPYEFTKPESSEYTKSWRETGNARKQQSFIEIDKYFESKKREGKKFKKKAYKEMNKQWGKKNGNNIR